MHWNSHYINITAWLDVIIDFDIILNGFYFTHGCVHGITAGLTPTTLNNDKLFDIIAISVRKWINMNICWLCVIYVRENTASNVKVMITQLIWITWTLLSVVQERPLNLITHSLTGKIFPEIISRVHKHSNSIFNSSPLVPHICFSESGQHWFR